MPFPSKKKGELQHMRNLRKLLTALIVVTMLVSSLGAFAEAGFW